MGEDILATIDGALEDYATSPDAMRWTPEPESAEPFLPAGAWGGVTLDEISVWLRVWADVTAWNESFRQTAQAMDGFIQATQAWLSQQPPQSLTDEAKTLLAEHRDSGDEPVFGVAVWPTGDLPECITKGDA